MLTVFKLRVLIVTVYFFFRDSAEFSKDRKIIKKNVQVSGERKWRSADDVNLSNSQRKLLFKALNKITTISGEKLWDRQTKNGLNPVLLLHSPFLLHSFFRKEEKRVEITSCRTFSDPIDFHPFSVSISDLLKI